MNEENKRNFFAIFLSVIMVMILFVGCTEKKEETSITILNDTIRFVGKAGEKHNYTTKIHVDIEKYKEFSQIMVIPTLNKKISHYAKSTTLSDNITMNSVVIYVQGNKIDRYMNGRLYIDRTNCDLFNITKETTIPITFQLTIPDTTQNVEYYEISVEIGGVIGDITFLN